MENTIGRQFVEMTKYKNLEKSLQSQGEPWPDLRLPLPEGAEVISLPNGKDLPLEKLDLIKLVDKRETFRSYTEESLTLQELAYLLWGTQGVKSILAEKPVTKRTVPSAGSRHAFETYMLINRVRRAAARSLPVPGARSQAGAPFSTENIDAVLTEACSKQPHVKNSAVTFFWTAVQLRMTWRYCQRGYRYYVPGCRACLPEPLSPG